MNHDTTPVYFSDRERGLLGYEYPVPGDEFTLLWRYPDIGHLLAQGFPDFSKDIFTRLYQRRAPLPSRSPVA